MRHRLFAHLVWSTLHRAPVLTLPAMRFLGGYFGRVAADERSAVIAFGGVRTHVHLLVRLHPVTTPSKLVQRFKGGSARIGPRDHGLDIRWHPGYSIDAVQQAGVPRVAAYIATQHRRHPREAIPGWPEDPAGAAARAIRNAEAFLAALDRERYGGEHRRPRGGS